MKEANRDQLFYFVIQRDRKKVLRETDGKDGNLPASESRDAERFYLQMLEFHLLEIHAH